MNEEVKKYLSDILFSVECIQEFVQDINFENYTKDIKTKSAVERQLGIIGEAINKIEKLTKEVSLNYSRQIVGMRNRIIHAYDSIDDEIVWAIVKKYLPELKLELKELLK
jgi:uncharacterized protein with HEPN domain